MSNMKDVDMIVKKCYVDECELCLFLCFGSCWYLQVCFQSKAISVLLLSSISSHSFVCCRCPIRDLTIKNLKVWKINRRVLFLCLVSKRKRTLNNLNQSTNPKQLRTISRLTVASCLDWCIGHCRRCRTGSPVEAGPVQHASHVIRKFAKSLFLIPHSKAYTQGCRASRPTSTQKDTKLHHIWAHITSVSEILTWLHILGSTSNSAFCGHLCRCHGKNLSNAPSVPKVQMLRAKMPWVTTLLCCGRTSIAPCCILMFYSWYVNMTTKKIKNS